MASCERDKVRVLRKEKGQDPKVASDRTNAKGTYSVEAPGRDGKYYAEVRERLVPADGLCLAAKSKPLKLDT